MPRTQTKLTNASRPAGPDAVEAADPTVMRLFANIDLARTVKQMIEHGSLDRDLLTEAQDFEQKAWRHLAAYLAATAFAEL